MHDVVKTGRACFMIANAKYFIKSCIFFEVLEGIVQYVNSDLHDFLEEV